MSQADIKAAHLLTRGRINARVDALEQHIDQSYAHTLAGVHAHITAFTQAMPDGDRVTWLHTAGHYTRFDDQIRRAIHAYAQRVMESLHTGIHDATALASDAAQAMLRAGMPPQMVAWQMRSADVRQVLREHLDRAQNLLNTFPAQTRDRLRTLLYSGIDSGNGPAALARDIEQVLGMTRSRALTIARTEMLGAYRAANLANFRANSDVVEKWQWSASATGACPDCADKNGQEFPLDTDMVSHPNCRCSPRPVTQSYADILSAYGITF